MTERKPHKYAEVIKAWADGKPIQYKATNWGEDKWNDYAPEDLNGVKNDSSYYMKFTPRFDQFEWRVKPENIFTEICVTPLCIYVSERKNNLRLEFDPDTKKLVKAEVIE